MKCSPLCRGPRCLVNTANPIKILQDITETVNLGKATLTALVLGTALTAPALAQVAPNGWIQGGCDDDGCSYFKRRSASPPFIIVEERNTRPPVKGTTMLEELTEYDCRGWRYRYKFKAKLPSSGRVISKSWGPWKDVLPGTVGEQDLRASCSLM